MKLFKIIFKTILTLSIFILISCASTPKEPANLEEKIEEDILIDLPPLETNETNITSPTEISSTLETEETLKSETTPLSSNEENIDSEVVESNASNINDELANTYTDETKTFVESFDESFINNDTNNDDNEITSNEIEQTNTNEKQEESFAAESSEENTIVSDLIQSSDKTTTVTDEIKTFTEETTKLTNEIATVTDETNNESEEIEIKEEEIIEDVKKEIIPSRSMKIKKNQYIDISYPGTGWIYLGQKDNKKDFTFFGRKLGGKDTSFTLRAKNAGTFILHFYKNDPLTSSYIDDYLEVIVEQQETTSTEHIIAPDYASIVPPKVTITSETIKEKENKKKEIAQQNISNNKPVKQEDAIQNSPNKKNIDPSIKTVIQTQDSEQQKETPKKTENIIEEQKITENKPVQKEIQNLDSLKESDLLKLAKTQFANKEHENALNTLEIFFEKAVSKIDEGLFLQGQILESKSNVQNIKGAIDSYELIVKNYPSSPYWAQANKRTIFLRRFYINIR